MHFGIMRFGDAAELPALARPAEQAGVESVRLAEHLARPVDIRSPCVRAAAAGSARDRPRGGTLDPVSGGRAVLGIGVGWSAEEFAAVGQEFRSRGARTDEIVAILRGLWGRSTARMSGLRGPTTTTANARRRTSMGHAPLAAIGADGSARPVLAAAGRNRVRR